MQRFLDSDVSRTTNVMARTVVLTDIEQCVTITAMLSKIRQGLSVVGLMAVAFMAQPAAQADQLAVDINTGGRSSVCAGCGNVSGTTFGWPFTVSTQPGRKRWPVMVIG